MTDRIFPSPYPEEEPGKPRRAQDNEEEQTESEPLDDDVDDADEGDIHEEDVPLP